MATTATIPQVFFSFSACKTRHDVYVNKQSLIGIKKLQNPTKRTVCSYHQHCFRIVVPCRGKFPLSEGKGCIFNDEKKRKNMKRSVLVRFNNLGFNGGGGGGGRGEGNTGRVLGNLALAIALTYLSFTGQLGWLLDAIASIWLIVVLVPIVGLGVFIWWAGRDMVVDSCPNCGNEFQVFKSTLNDELQLCPYCSQPFSVVDDEFVRDPVKFSNESTTFGEAFSEFSSRSKKGKRLSRDIIDIEAEVRDVD